MTLMLVHTCQLQPAQMASCKAVRRLTSQHKNVCYRALKGDQVTTDSIKSQTGVHLHLQYILQGWRWVSREYSMLDLSTMATLGTEDSGHCREVYKRVNVETVC